MAEEDGEVTKTPSKTSHDYQWQQEFQKAAGAAVKCHCLQWAPCRPPYSGCKVSVSSQPLLMLCISEATGGLYSSLLAPTSSLPTSFPQLKSIFWLQSKRKGAFVLFFALCPKKNHPSWIKVCMFQNYYLDFWIKKMIVKVGNRALKSRYFRVILW